MKSLILFLMACMLMPFTRASAQAKLPQFVIADIEGKYHHISSAKIKKEVLLIYFMPDCDDCRAFTTKLAKDNSLFSHYQVIMVTNSTLPVLKKFVTDFQLTNKPNLIIGTEGWTATLQRLLNVERFPFVAIYGANGKLIRNFTDPNNLFHQTL